MIFVVATLILAQASQPAEKLQIKCIYDSAGVEPDAVLKAIYVDSKSDDPGVVATRGHLESAGQACSKKYNWDRHKTDLAFQYLGPVAMRHRASSKLAFYGLTLPPIDDFSSTMDEGWRQRFLSRTSTHQDTLLLIKMIEKVSSKFSSQSEKEAKEMGVVVGEVIAATIVAENLSREFASDK